MLQMTSSEPQDEAAGQALFKASRTESLTPYVPVICRGAWLVVGEL